MHSTLWKIVPSGSLGGRFEIAFGGSRLNNMNRMRARKAQAVLTVNTVETGIVSDSGFWFL